MARRDGQDFDCATWLHKARSMPKEDFRREVEKELTGREEEPSELIYFKVYKSQIPVIEQAIETASLMLGTDKSRGYCLEMICADFLAGAHLDMATRRSCSTRSRATTSSCPANSARLSSGSRCYAGTAGGARVAARCRISRFTTGSCVASPGMMQSKTSLRFALHAIHSCIGELIEAVREYNFSAWKPRLQS
jgi:hypothetical protein